jgi:hypothetical protein
LNGEFVKVSMVVEKNLRRVQSVESIPWVHSQW